MLRESTTKSGRNLKPHRYRREKLFQIRLSNDEQDMFWHTSNLTGECMSALVRRVVREEAQRVERVVTRLQKRQSGETSGG